VNQGPKPREGSKGGDRLSLSSLISRQCTRITVDVFEPPVVLWFIYDGPTARLEIMAPFTIQANGETWDLDPSTAQSRLGPLLALLGQRITDADELPGSRLSLKFGEGVSLVVRGNTDEPWWLDLQPDV
jgi:hypothetical protein